MKIFHLRLGMSQQFSLSAPLEHCDLKLPLYCRKHTAETKANTSDAAETKEAVDDKKKNLMINLPHFPVVDAKTGAAI